KYAICRACIRVLGREAAHNEKFTNTKKECARHIQNCPNFASLYTSEQIKELLDKAKKDNAKSPNKSAKRTQTPAKNLSSDDDENDSHLIEPISALSENNLDNYIFRSLTTSQINKLEELLLEVTVSCGFAFQWIENDAVKRLFHWLNPMITLPTRKVLGGRIL